MHFILDIGISRLSIILTKNLCDVNKQTKAQNLRLIYQNITKQKSSINTVNNVNNLMFINNCL